jgi:hypothetical protein
MLPLEPQTKMRWNLTIFGRRGTNGKEISSEGEKKRIYKSAEGSSKVEMKLRPDNMVW